MLRVRIPDGNDESPVDYVFRTHASKLSGAALKYSSAVYEHTLLSLREMEAARVRTAQIDGCEICSQVQAARDFNERLSQGGKPFQRVMNSRGHAPDAAFYAAIAEWRIAPNFTPRERLAMEYAELMGLRPRPFDPDEIFWERVHGHFSDEELVDLTFSISSWIAMGRVLHTLGLDTVCAPMRRQACAERDE
jgi:alkylhydroperoxidase family enzyme